jgi:hypothetical protein
MSNLPYQEIATGTSADEFGPTVITGNDHEHRGGLPKPIPIKKDPAHGCTP